MEKILILGADGFLGFHLGRKFLHNYEVHGYVRSKKNMKRPKHPEIIYHDSKKGLINTIFSTKPDYVINTVTKYVLNFEDDFFDSNLILPIKSLRASYKCDVKLFVNTDSFFNDPNNISSYLKEYTLSKKHLLEWIKQIKPKGIKFVNMKIFHMYGEKDSTTKFVTWLVRSLLKNDKEINLTSGDQLRDFIHVDDVAEAYYRVISDFSKIIDFSEFEVGTGNAISLKSFIQKTKILSNSSSTLKFGVLKYRKGEIMSSTANNSKLVQLGWQPKINLERGLKKIIESEL